MADSDLLIYGANGYTGKLITDLAVSRGLNPVVAGRNGSAITELAKKHSIDQKIFDLGDHELIVKNIEGFKVVLHCAGPFHKTAKPMIKACLEAQVNYLDITGEMEIFEYAASLSEKAKKSGILLMPGVGFDVVPTDCLAAHLHSLLPDATHLELAFKGSGGISKGTANTMLDNFHRGGAIRENGKIKKVPSAYEVRKIKFGNKEYTAATIPWGDVSTAYHSTAIPNIKVFTTVKPKGVKMMKLSNTFGGLLQIGFVKAFLKKKVDKIEGPSANHRAKASSLIWGLVSDANGNVKEAELTTPEGYQLTAMTAVEIADRVLNRSIFPGFKTPSGAFGADFILQFEGVERKDL
ncbi:MAG: saccharopine dehydrogenase NADP-binding domain-containing protein [Cyclobacteriaceae bacterium]